MGMALAGCGSSSKTSSSSSATTVAPTTTAPPSVKVTQDPKEGAIVTDNAGRSLYMFAKDTGTTSACTSTGCATAWPAYIAAGGTATGGDGVDASKLSTATGQAPNQVTYYGHLLYYFARDTGPGQTNGLSIPNWFLVGPDGSQVKK